MNVDGPLPSDPASMGAAQLSRAIVARQLSPVDVVDAFLARIDRLEPKLQAFVEVYGANVRLAAEGADKMIRAGNAVGPLHGVPVALKDLIDLEGKITTGGSPSKRDRRSVVTATVAKRMLAQGMIVLGKTHTVEFAMGGWGTNEHMGTPWNPWDLEVPRTPGGSSSGSGVAVAAGLAPWAIGTDTGGSVRLPASYCGLTGLKVTVGRISTYGIIPLSSTLDTPGPMTRNVEDAALLYHVLAGPDPLDPLTRGLPQAEGFSSIGRGVRGLRLARMPAAERDGVSPEMLAAYDASLATFEMLGAEIVDLALPFAFMDIVAANDVTFAESFFFNRATAEDAGLPVDEAVRKRVLAGKGISAHDYLRTKRRQVEWKAAFNERMSSIDALLTPTTETAAIPLADVDQEKVPSRFTRFGNLLELCALALPNGVGAGGLPLSLQIMCRSYEEAMALRIGTAWQGATDFHTRRPALG